MLYVFHGGIIPQSLLFLPMRRKDMLRGGLFAAVSQFFSHGKDFLVAFIHFIVNHV